jgi:hypothetical protein
MADAAGASPLEVAAWEAGTMPVPSVQARRLRELAAGDQYRAAMLEPGPRRMAPCAWAQQHAPGLHELLWYEPREVESNPGVQAHLEDCAPCRQVLELGRAHRAHRAASPAFPGHLGYGLDTMSLELLLLLAGVAGTVLVILVGWLVEALEARYPGLPVPDDLWAQIMVAIVALGLTHRATVGPLRKLVADLTNPIDDAGVG